MPRAGAFLLALAVVLLAEWAHASYIDPGDDDLEVNLPDYGEDPADLQLLQDVGKRSSLIYVFRRACVRRGGNCDHRPGDCCHSSSCRCNLWGSNCRCQRMGLFQKWGQETTTGAPLKRRPTPASRLDRRSTGSHNIRQHKTDPLRSYFPVLFLHIVLNYLSSSIQLNSN